ncbi:hypothetical protein CPB84DRAFT_1769334 [Gymnopilus junonius]|uniref:DUF2470 domain-containing protein n=1 Tax=Gymnopilus junonius TaxID=109634 RepID=A0A9P5NVV3_GYMJU|nr:hypothetical protein CPB84DRAFT_1769334 [Gymnopilus junonius]
MYMSSHPDTLVAYAKWFGKVEEVIKSAEMTAIDTKSMTLTCTLQGGSKKVVVVPIEPPLKGYDDVKPRLLEMKAIAQEGLGMIKAPKITFFEFPRDAWYSAPLILFAVFVHLWKGQSSTAGYLADAVVSYTGTGVFTFSYWFIIVSHSLESLYMFSLCRRHSTGFLLGTAYVFSTAVAGFPTWMKLRQNIQAARINSVMKIE